MKRKMHISKSHVNEFRMGLARFLMLLLGLPSIRETTYLFRGPNRLLP